MLCPRLAIGLLQESYQLKFVFIFSCLAFYGETIEGD